MKKRKKTEKKLAHPRRLANTTKKGILPGMLVCDADGVGMVIDVFDDHNIDDIAWNIFQPGYRKTGLCLPESYIKESMTIITTDKQYQMIKTKTKQSKRKRKKL